MLYVKIHISHTKKIAAVCDFELVGKTLVIRTQAVGSIRTASRGNYAGFSFDPSAQGPNAREILIPYQDTFTPLIRFGAPGNESFYSAYVDITRSNSNGDFTKVNGRRVGQTFLWSALNSSYIAPENDADYPSFDETAYLTVSQKAEETFTHIYREPSPYRAELNTRVPLDIWYLLDTSSFNRTQWFIERAKQFGMDNLWVTIQHWAYRGFDGGNPQFYPADDALGGPQRGSADELPLNARDKCLLAAKRACEHRAHAERHREEFPRRCPFLYHGA